jgi:GDP-L-fucose synthase
VNPSSKIYVAGHRGLVGAALIRRLQEAGYRNLLVRDRNELDLANHEAVRVFFQSEHPEYVLLAAAKVGGILANSSYPADFIRLNLQPDECDS